MKSVRISYDAIRSCDDEGTFIKERLIKEGFEPAKEVRRREDPETMSFIFEQ